MSKITMNKVFFHKKSRQFDGGGYKGDSELQIMDTEKMQKYSEEMKNKYFLESIHGHTKLPEKRMGNWAFMAH